MANLFNDFFIRDFANQGKSLKTVTYQKTNRKGSKFLFPVCGNGISMVVSKLKNKKTADIF